jgi:membrane fusion protein (multidrug efflux system)
MASSFHRTSQSLRLDRGIWSITAFAVAITLTVAWLVWAFKAIVVRYEISDSARLEVAAAPYPVEAQIAGKLTASRLVLGREVQAGEILVELESRSEQLHLEQERIHRASLAPQIAALRSEVESDEQGNAEERTAVTAAASGAEAQQRQAEAQAALAEQEAARANRLRSEGLIPEAEAQRANADAKSKRAAVESMKASVARLEPELQVRRRDREATAAETRADIARLELEAATSAANAKRLEFEIENRRIRAPITGRLSECATLRPGAYITAGQQLGIIVPGSTLQVVAEFSAEAALGKIHPGQNAIVKLEGFPWAQFGTLSARVARVAGEIRNGKVRVELAVKAPAGSRIPLQHGLPGSVEIEVERISPAVLLLRSAGQAAGAR